MRQKVKEEKWARNTRKKFTPKVREEREMFFDDDEQRKEMKLKMEKKVSSVSSFFFPSFIDFI